MGIYIKGMEMPTMCSECDFCGGLILPDNIYTCDCPSEKIHGKNITRAIDEDCRHPNCPLIPVPEHGRLIDADALADQAFSYELNDGDSCSELPMVFLKDVEEAPTVIPADGKDTDVPTREEET